MKYLLLFLDGLAGDASPRLDDRTPLEAAERSALDAMAATGRAAAIEPDPWGRAMTEESLLGLALGIDPAVDPLGPAVLAGAAMGDVVPGGVVRLALDLVTIEAGVLLHGDAGGLTDAEGKAVATALAPAARGIHPRARVRAIAGHRLALDLPEAAAPDPLGMLPPAALVGGPVDEATPAGDGSAAMRTFMAAAADTLARLELITVRRDAGLPVPTDVWPWGLGRGGRRLDLAGRYEGRRFVMVGRGEAEAGVAAIAGLPSRRPSASDPAAFVADVRAAFGSAAGAGAGAGAALDAEASEGAGADVVIAWWRPAVRPDDAVGRAAAATAADALVVGPLRAHLAADHPDDWRMAAIAGPARATEDGRLLDAPLIAAFEGTGFHGPLELPFVESSADEAELRFRPGDDLLDYLLFGAGIRRPRRPRRPREAASTVAEAETAAAAQGEPPVETTASTERSDAGPGEGGQR